MATARGRSRRRCGPRETRHTKGLGAEARRIATLLGALGMLRTYMASTMNEGALSVQSRDRDSSAGASVGAGASRALDKARRLLNNPLTRAAEALGQRYLRRLTRVGTLAETAVEIPKRMQRAANQAQLVLELLEDVKAGRYRELPWRSVAIASAAVLYTVSPADVIPDVIPLLGTLDDITILTVSVRLIRRDLRAYCRYKGYPEEDYFDSEERPSEAPAQQRPN